MLLEGLLIGSILTNCVNIPLIMYYSKRNKPKEITTKLVIENLNDKKKQNEIKNTA